MNKKILANVELELRSQMAKATLLKVANKSTFYEILDNSINKKLSSAHKSRAYRVMLEEARRLQDSFAKRDPISARAYISYLTDREDVYVVGSYAHANRQIKNKVREYLSSVKFLDSTTRIKGPITTNANEEAALAIESNFTSAGVIEPGSLNQVSKLTSIVQSLVNKNDASISFRYIIEAYNTNDKLPDTFYKHFNTQASSLIDSTGLGSKVAAEAFETIAGKKTSQKRTVSRTQVVQGRGSPKVSEPPRVYKTKANKNISVVALINTINRRLPQTLRKEMHSPKLVWRTGRFANSVRVIDIKGDVITYNYMIRPYAVFEMSPLGNSRWATPDRDPRDLIDISVRQIAASVVDQKFRTRRGM